MLLKIDTESELPIYLQIVQQIKYQIIKGFLRPGDKLPSQKQLAPQLRINPKTVSRAYQELEKQKVIKIKPDFGIFISGKIIITDERKKLLDCIIDEISNRIINSGLNEDEINYVLEEFRKQVVSMRKANVRKQ
ncbi:MAG: GntR family transcriptional regulator [Candidatus Omnitrophica bacterium]|nr:GntR family transcriptional regulator [Candidatus Omnitrophota bacterium]